MNLFFDKEKNLLVKMETRGKNPMAGGEEFTATTLYEDYNKVDGIMVAHKVTVKRDDKMFVESTITGMLNGKVVEKVNVPGARTATGLPNGRYLVASQNNQRAYKIDRTGKIVWEVEASGPTVQASRR